MSTRGLTPNVPDLEISVLGACLIDPKAARLAAETLRPSDFFDDGRRLTFSTIQRLVQAGTPVDRVTVKAAEIRIPATMLADLEEAVPTAVNAAHYIEQVRACGRSRTILDAGKRLVAHLSENGKDPDAHLRDFYEVAGQATREADDAPTPAADVTREGDDFHFRWPTLAVEITVSRLRDAGDGVQSELTITRDGRPLHWGRINLASLSARDQLVTKLNRTKSKIPWREVIEDACRDTVIRFREGSPTVELVPRRGVVERRLMDKLVLDQDINVVFSDGGSGKSLLALAGAVAVRTGTALPGGLIPRRTGPVLYLDWESCQEEHEERLAGLLAGLRVSGPVPIAYRKMVGALADDAALLRHEVAKEGAVLVIVDSLVPACGAEPETADATIRAFAALRSFGVASLVLAHVNKTMADARGTSRPFGSVFVQNLPRNVWELRKAEDAPDDTLMMGLYHRKTNRGRLLPPFGLQFRFDGDRTTIQSADVTQDAGLRERAGLSYSIKAVLRTGGHTIAELAKKIETSEDNVLKALYRLEKSGVVVRVGEQKPAPGRPVIWGLHSRTEDVAGGDKF
jgi:hypothetical protein